MLYLLKRHPVPVTAFFRHALVLAYAYPPEILEPLLPEGLALDTWPGQERGWGFLAVALVKTENLRPSFLPRALGRDFFLSGYRIFVRVDTGHLRGNGRLLGSGRSLRGLRILRSDTDRPLMARAGNLLTHYNYHLCEAEIEERCLGECNRGERGIEMRWVVRTPRGEADLDVTASIGNEQAALPASSPFQSIHEARRFAGPLPYTFDYEKATRSIIAIRATRQEWNPQPVAVDVKRIAFLECEPFCRVRPILANAFYVRDVPYRWERGRRLT
jgi:Uncharacterized conserved protein (COG2071)